MKQPLADSLTDLRREYWLTVCTRSAHARA